MGLANMFGFSIKQFTGIFIALIGIFIVVPVLIAVTERWDFYYTLTSVALLSIASGGVWLTFYIGRINIGQGAYALIGGYVSAILVTKYGVNFWLSLPLAGLFCAILSVGIGLPILRLKGVYFAMVTLVLTECGKTCRVSITDYQWGEGDCFYSTSRRVILIWSYSNSKLC